VPWPPQLDDLKAELRIDRADTADDANLQVALDAAVEFVEEKRAGDFNFTGATTGTEALLPAPGRKILLGTLRLAVREHTLRRSPDGMIDAGEFGRVAVPRGMADIELMLGIGVYRPPMVL
jgi:hypothetical protein